MVTKPTFENYLDFYLKISGEVVLICPEEWAIIHTLRHLVEDLGSAGARNVSEDKGQIDSSNDFYSVIWRV